MLEIIRQIIVQFFGLTWWLWAFIILWPLFSSTWLYYRREKFKSEIKWVLLELRIPREIRKSPRAMEQVLEALHQLRNVAGNFREKWWDGEVTRWFSLEMVSLGGEVHMYIRCYHKQRNLVEAAFFAYYPDVEIVEVEDYTERFPNDIREMYSQGYDVWGTEMVLKKEDAYPIRSYLEFESPDEDKQYDPAAAFLEVLAKLKPEEMVGIQIQIAPADSKNWVQKWKGLVESLSHKRAEGRGPAFGTLTEFPGGPLPAFAVAKKEGAQDPAFLRTFMRSPGETDVLKAVENNLSKPAFDTLIRFVYLSPKSLFYDSFARRGLVGSFNQYGSLDLNGFIQNYAMSSRAQFWDWPHIFSKTRVEYRKQRLLYNYKRRKNPVDTFMGRLISSHFFNWNFYSRRVGMNTESLATLFHPPTFIVLTGPHIKRVESRKLGPPAGLAIYGDEGDLEKFQG